MFSNILEMRKTDLNGTRMSILFETTYSNIIDYDYRQEMWYWVSTESHRVSGVSLHLTFFVLYTVFFFY